MNSDKKVLILGGGFAGVEAAIYLRKEKFDVTLISDREYLYVYPTSIWFPVRKVEFEDISVSLDKLKKVHGFNWIKDEVIEIQAKEGKVVCKNNEYSGYDYLVIALGAGKVPQNGRENFLSICGKPDEAIKIRARIDELVKKGSGKIAMGFGGNPKDKSAVRGGPAFELLFNVHDYLKKKKIRNNFELIFFAPMEKPGMKMGVRALGLMDMFFRKLNIKKYIGTPIDRFEKDGIILSDDTKIESDLTMFIPAGQGIDIFQKSGLPVSEAGFITINDYSQVKYEDGRIQENVFAIGDSAALEGPDWKAKQGHVAEVMARNTAFNIAAIEKGSDERKGYSHHLNILCVMDGGNGASFVFRNDKKAFMIPMPIIGHWMKKGWGWYFRNSKLNKIPRIPGM